MNSFISRPLHERLELIGQTAAKYNMAPAAIEKDFWVCWVLRQLFQSPLRHSIIFKGGKAKPYQIEQVREHIIKHQTHEK